MARDEEDEELGGRVEFFRRESLRLRMDLAFFFGEMLRIEEIDLTLDPCCCGEGREASESRPELESSVPARVPSVEAEGLERGTWTSPEEEDLLLSRGPIRKAGGRLGGEAATGGEEGIGGGAEAVSAWCPVGCEGEGS